MQVLCNTCGARFSISDEIAPEERPRCSACGAKSLISDRPPRDELDTIPLDPDSLARLKRVGADSDPGPRVTPHRPRPPQASIPFDLTRHASVAVGARGPLASIPLELKREEALALRPRQTSVAFELQRTTDPGVEETETETPPSLLRRALPFFVILLLSAAVALVASGIVDPGKVRAFLHWERLRALVERFVH